MKKFVLVLPLFLLLWSCGGGKKVTADAPPSNLNEPDRVLFERAMHDLNKNKFTVARLTLQTLINTYQDSEYLERAKYNLAESFYRENSGASLTQAETSLKDFITFFPVSELADDAQLKIAMTHIRQMEKPDRDNTQARLAELELKAMIDMYPDSNLLDEAKSKLRQVQEVIAEGVRRIADQYYVRRSYPAALSRYKEVLTKYPDYSKVPYALYNIGEMLHKVNNNGESAVYFARIVSEHPLSDRVEDAKRRLKEFNVPIPDPNPVALARAQLTQGQDRGVFGKMFSMFNRRPQVSGETAAASSAGAPQEEPAAEAAPTSLRGGTSNAGGANDSGNFSIDPKVVQPGKQQPAKKPH